MSVETSRTNSPGDGDSDDEQKYGYRSADSAAAVDDDLDDDELDDDTVASVDGGAVRAAVAERLLVVGFAVTGGVRPAGLYTHR